MNLAFSYAVILHRAYDSSPPEKAAVFRADDRVLRPYGKPNGLYVFVDAAEQEVVIDCAGYQTEKLLPKMGEVHHVFLYPNRTYNPPNGWHVLPLNLPPNAVCFRQDKRFNVRLVAVDFEEMAVRLRAKPGFIGGALQLSHDSFVQIAMITGKKPPDLYYLDSLDKDVLGGAVSDINVEKGYIARADAFGNCVLVLPNGYQLENDEKGGEVLSDRGQ